ncbi:CubicO group peptidase (beta-lactamase class C family) [Dyadobacter sp. BE34]|uniref:CubicO group peptidase (Beta-lactamase class C family) n=1 Tax=Dyadobacter fermentans TaxID=94254 RepID=A0ABU1R0I0_9BACT|nr:MULTISPECIES: serine hydrolase domain-containing protein [Dyadobacter]MDR6806916.1 CubicO group peptidase (beta-lactamase class C family) [Dyadobacter fermentans]MDR7044658.1 CubicO group peptidase (beta-lactamase class C family) [Dyadobacter sp. BE242]MDR7198968.1 CubicO group peptidase (beta-lactamase class C family) [Dyadobacter sp. BE34]MDR7216930.1 CubicO group peptidase (beta-lactamase class C family) [Dyadobacter sp. BE31]MDR7263544.1 CubicO group peptidase (beta-lactamase class C fa
MKNQRLFLILSFLLVVFHVQADDLDDFIRNQMRKRGIPGLSLAIIQDGKILKAQAYGFIDKEGKVPVTTNTLFQAGSVSKSVAAMGALCLVEKSKLSLDEDVNLKLKSWKVPDNEFTNDKKVTLRGLLSHTTGLTVHGFPGYAVGAKIPSVVQILDGTAPANTPPVRVDFVPGSRWRYSGGGYTVMQQLMVDVTGADFPEFMKNTVLSPLGMRNSTYQQPLPPELAKMTAIGHYNNRSAVEGRWHIYPEMAAAGLWTTSSDLARFAIAVQNAYAGKSGNVLSQAMTRQMLTDQKNRDGLGVFLQGDSATLRFGHNGRDEGFDALLTASVGKGQGVAIMINANDNSHMMNRIVDFIADYYHWNGFPVKTAKPVTVDVDPNTLKAFEGRYELFNNRMVTFQAENQRLFTLEDGFVDEEFVPVAHNKFTSTDRNVSVIFNSDGAGNVIGFTLEDNDQNYQRKVPRIGPLAAGQKTTADPDPSRTPKIMAALQAMVKGGKILEEATGFTPGAKRDFAGGMREPETLKSLTFIHSENVAGRGIQRHESEVSEIVTYQLKSNQPDTYILVHLTADGLVTDCDLVEK